MYVPNTVQQNMKKILVLLAHPAFRKSVVNKALIQNVRKLSNVTVHELYEEYPDFFIDIQAEQKLLLAHDIIVWHHPFYWYSAPALLKEWMDLVLQHGFAYGKEGRQLEGKWLMTAVSTGGKSDVYSHSGRNRFTMNEFLVPFRQAAELCRMVYLPPFVTHGAHTIGKAELDKQAMAYRNTLLALRDGNFSIEDFKGLKNINSLTASHV